MACNIGVFWVSTAHLDFEKFVKISSFCVLSNSLEPNLQGFNSVFGKGSGYVKGMFDETVVWLYLFWKTVSQKSKHLVKNLVVTSLDQGFPQKVAFWNGNPLISEKPRLGTFVQNHLKMTGYWNSWKCCFRSCPPEIFSWERIIYPPSRRQPESMLFRMAPVWWDMICKYQTSRKIQFPGGYWDKLRTDAPKKKRGRSLTFHFCHPGDLIGIFSNNGLWRSHPPQLL